MIANEQLTPNFSLYELTATNRAEFLGKNRMLTTYHIQKLKMLAMLLEQIRGILDVPLTITSGYRCPELNSAVGSSEMSQHLRCEAADFVPKSLDLAQAFKLLRQAAKENKLHFGQLIWEKAERSYGVAEWLHVSMGQPYRGEERCGEVLTMVDGKFHLIEQIKKEPIA